jgi:colanic acid biosynthesis glycosyl transferase WcaI
VRIWIITQYFHPENFGINQVAAALVGRGHAVTVLTGMPNYPSGRFAPAYRWWRVEREVYAGASVVHLPIIPRGDGTAFRLAVNFLSFAAIATISAPFLLRGRPDAIFVYQPSPLTVTFPAMVLSWLRRAPIVLWVQDLWPESLILADIPPSPLVLRIIARVARFVYRRCALILLQSPAYSGPIRAAAPHVPLRYFPNSADPRYRPLDTPPEALRPAELPPGFRVLFAGNIGAAQDFETIVAAAEQVRHVPEIQWVIIGEGRRKEWLQNQITTRKLGGTVHLINPLPSELMPHYFAFAHGLLLTLAARVAALTIPTKLQAYLACGRPIIAAIDGEAARILRESGAGLTCEPGNAGALAAVVQTLYQMSPGQRDKMGSAGRRCFEREFALDLLMDRLEQWLIELNTKPMLSDNTGRPTPADESQSLSAARRH